MTTIKEWKWAAAAVLAASLCANAVADKIVSADCALSADEDWTADGLVTLSGATIDLAGHSLKVAAMNGSGTIMSSNTEFLDLTTTNGLSSANKFIWASTNGVEVALAGTGGNGVDGSKYPAERAFDNVCGDTKVTLTAGGEQNFSFMYFSVKETFWNGSNSFELNYDFGAATTANGYRIYPYSSAANAGYPKTWSFEGSNDGATWDELDSQSDVTLSKGTWYSYPIENTTAYRYYRIKVSEVKDNGTKRVDIGEFEIGTGPANKLQFDLSGLAASDISGITIADGVTLEADMAAEDTVSLSGDLDLSGMEFSIAGTIDLNGHTLAVDSLSGGGMVTDTAAFDKTTAQNDASRVSSYVNGAATALSQPAWQAFGDFESYSSSGTPQHRVLCYPFVSPTDIDYDFGAATVIDSFRLAIGSNNSAGTRAPRAMRFYGWDGAEWMELGKWTKQTDWDKNETRRYDFANTNSYSKYRIRFEENNGDNCLEFFKLEYGCRAEAGRLVVNVPSGATEDNSDVTIAGNARLVKAGAGTLVASKASQTYTGGTEVQAGTLRAGAASDGLFGPDGSEVRIMGDGSFDTNGQNGSIGKYFYALFGGCLAECGADVASSSGYRSILDIALKGDSTFNAEKSMYIGSGTSGIDSQINLGGNTLSGHIASDKFPAS